MKDKHFKAISTILFERFIANAITFGLSLTASYLALSNGSVLEIVGGAAIITLVYRAVKETSLWIETYRNVTVLDEIIITVDNTDEGLEKLEEALKKFEEAIKEDIDNEK